MLPFQTHKHRKVPNVSAAQLDFTLSITFSLPQSWQQCWQHGTGQGRIIGNNSARFSKTYRQSYKMTSGIKILRINFWLIHPIKMWILQRKAGCLQSSLQWAPLKISNIHTNIHTHTCVVVDYLTRSAAPASAPATFV